MNIYSINQFGGLGSWFLLFLFNLNFVWGMPNRSICESFSDWLLLDSHCTGWDDGQGGNFSPAEMVWRCFVITIHPPKTKRTTEPTKCQEFLGEGPWRFLCQWDDFRVPAICCCFWGGKTQAAKAISWKLSSMSIFVPDGPKIQLKNEGWNK